MGARAGIALKGLQWFIRGVQFLSAAIVFAIYCYFLATLNSRSLEVPDWVRAVVGITGFACLYSGVGMVVLCWIAGRKVTSFFAIVLDVAFAAAFIFVAVSNKGGSSSCEGGGLSTPFGDGDANASRADGMPNYYTACKLQSACLGVAVIALFFFIFSAATEVALGRHHHRENRIGPSLPDDGHTPIHNYSRDNFGRAGSSPYDAGGRYASTSPHDAARRYSSTNPYDTGVPGPYPGSYSRPRPSDDNRNPARQYPPGYRYSDGVYDA
ncbi:hypothetical protein MAPG_07309 [Magnaporthiopsis poae ATCC 64411]|uniref:MARVEL domain-containing protein n=1 Tax=Magnaporthiopsis poae (strain ATCC 64411 / 73-15) TaxID=644358 RepID=A0A0C4E4B7_MAGP6|nr:hypothetical protein MAPG_07309 [Magnaporthiopsis poae ATCC 64411]